MLNVLQRIGGAIGVAVLAVILQRQLEAAQSRDDIAAGFGATYWWSMAVVAVALIPALYMWREQRRTAGAAEFGPALPEDAELSA